MPERTTTRGRMHLKTPLKKQTEDNYEKAVFDHLIVSLWPRNL